MSRTNHRATRESVTPARHRKSAYAPSPPPCAASSSNVTVIAARTSTIAASAAARHRAWSSTITSPSPTADHPAPKTSRFTARPTTPWPPIETSAERLPSHSASTLTSPNGAARALRYRTCEAARSQGLCSSSVAGRAHHSTFSTPRCRYGGRQAYIGNNRARARRIIPNAAPYTSSTQEHVPRRARRAGR